MEIIYSHNIPPVCIIQTKEGHVQKRMEEVPFQYGDISISFQIEKCILKRIGEEGKILLMGKFIENVFKNNFFGQYFSIDFQKNIPRAEMLCYGSYHSPYPNLYEKFGDALIRDQKMSIPPIGYIKLYHSGEYYIPEKENEFIPRKFTYKNMDIWILIEKRIMKCMKKSEELFTVVKFLENIFSENIFLQYYDLEKTELTYEGRSDIHIIDEIFNSRNSDIEIFPA